MLSNPSFPHSPFPQLPSPHGVFCSKSSTFKLFFIIPYCVNFLLVQDLIISCLHCWNISQNLLPLQGQTVIVASSLVSLSLVVPAIPLPPAPIHWAHTGRLMFLMPLPCSKKHAKAPTPLGLTGYATLWPSSALYLWAFQLLHFVHTIVSPGMFVFRHFLCTMYFVIYSNLLQSLANQRYRQPFLITLSCSWNISLAVTTSSSGLTIS